MSRLHLDRDSGATSGSAASARMPSAIDLGAHASSFNLENVQDLRAALTSMKTLLDARYLDFRMETLPEERSAAAEWRRLSGLLDINNERALFLNPMLRTSNGEDIGKLSDLLAASRSLRLVKANDLEKLDFLDRQMANDLGLYGNEQKLVENLRYQIRGRGAGAGCLSDAEATLLEEVWKYRDEFRETSSVASRPSFEDMGLTWVEVERGNRIRIEPAPLTGVYAGTSLLKLSSYFFLARLNLLDPANSPGDRAAQQVFQKALEATRLREGPKGNRDRSDEAWSALLGELVARYYIPF